MPISLRKPLLSDNTGLAKMAVPGLPKKNLALQGPLVLNSWKKPSARAHHPTPLLQAEIYQLLAKIVTPLEHTLAESIIHYHHMHYERLELTNRLLDDALRLANALNQLADITEYRLLGKSENLKSGLTLTELAKLAYDHYANKSEFISVFFRRCFQLRQDMVPLRSHPLRPHDRAVTNSFLSRVLLAKAST